MVNKAPPVHDTVQSWYVLIKFCYQEGSCARLIHFGFILLGVLFYFQDTTKLLHQLVFQSASGMLGCSPWWTPLTASVHFSRMLSCYCLTKCHSQQNIVLLVLNQILLLWICWIWRPAAAPDVSVSVPPRLLWARPHSLFWILGNDKGHIWDPFAWEGSQDLQCIKNWLVVLLFGSELLVLYL